MSDIAITHPNKILYPDKNISKQQLVDFYANISAYLLPYIQNRPLVLVRCPEGQGKECFFHKHLQDQSSKALHTINIAEKGHKKPYLYIKDCQGLIELIQLNVLEIHPWACCIDQIEKPDRVIFDLDQAPDVSWSKVIHAARFIKKELEKIKIHSFVKTSGGKGLHIVIPLKPSLSWQDIKLFAETFAKFIASKNPDEYITTMSKEKRHGKIFIDYLRNTRGATTVAAYSTRANKNAAVSTPLSWQELSPKIHSTYYTVHNLPQRLAHLTSDPWAGFYELQQVIPGF